MKAKPRKADHAEPCDADETIAWLMPYLKHGSRRKLDLAKIPKF